MSDEAAEAGSGGFQTRGFQILKSGTKVGPARFTLIKELGRGGMGVVWLAQDTSLGEQVALKFLPPEVCHDPVALNDLRRETVRSHRLTHPNIIRIHDFHQQPDGVAFISMEYVDGTTLSGGRLQQEKQVFAWEQLAPLVKQLCATLEYAHGEGVIHRDLKPANVMLDRRGRVKLADFGIAAVVSDSLSRVSVRSSTGGTLAYMSPQQLRGQRPTVADDVYALGASLYELLTGRPPFYTGDLTHQVLHEPVVPLDERALELGVDNPVPEQVAALVMACLAKDPTQRPATAHVVLDWIGSAQSGALGHLAPNDAGVAPEAEAARIGGAGSRKSLMWAGGTVALLLLVGGLFFLFGGKSKSGGRATVSSTQSPRSWPTEAVWMPLDIGGACSDDIISTASRKAANQFTYNGGTFASASWLRKNGYPEPGLPDDGRVPIPDSSPPGFFQVRMPPAKNAILLSGPAGFYPQPATIELTAKDRRRYSELVILHTTCHGNGSLRVTLQYETGSETRISIPVLDWFPAARTGLLPTDLRVAVTSHDTTGGLVAQMLAQRISADPQRRLASLTLSFESLMPPTRSSVQAGAKHFTCGIFALSALPASAPTAAVSARSTNSLGMVFLPVPGTDVQFSIWETRVRDFEAFFRETRHDAAKEVYSVNADGWKQRGDSWSAPGFPKTPDHPVCGVNWDDARAFCHWLTERERRDQRLPRDEEYRLPTDLEWSAAVDLRGEVGAYPADRKARLKGVYPWGERWPPPAGAGNYAGEESRTKDSPSDWRLVEGYRDGYPRTAPVGSFAPNRNGMFDLGGNVWEWCEDLLSPDSPFRVLRGAAFGLELEQDMMLSSARHGAYPVTRLVNRGFRCVRGKVRGTTFGETAQWTNSLGMIFVPVLGTDVKFSIWETRVGDFEAFVDAAKPDMGNELVMGRSDGWKNRPGYNWRNPGFPQGPTHPVVGVNWDDAQAFCRWLTESERASVAITMRQRYRLPTDAEWSAAVGPAKFPWGDTWPPPPRSGNYGGTETIGADWPVNTWGRMTNYTDAHVFSAPVGSYPPNANGLFDLGGNVWEWCEDRYRAEMNPRELREVFKSMNNDGGSERKRVFRGASWVDPHLEILASANRLGTGTTMPDARCDTVGFRVVLETSTATSAPVTTKP